MATLLRNCPFFTAAWTEGSGGKAHNFLPEAEHGRNKTPLIGRKLLDLRPRSSWLRIIELQSQKSATAPPSTPLRSSYTHAVVVLLLLLSAQPFI